MASVELAKLYKLHLIDNGLVEVKKKAAALEAGKKMLAELEVLKKRAEAANAEYHRVHGEQKDLELNVQQIEDKIKGIDKLLFGGSVVNPKEIEAYESQKVSLRKNISESEDKLLVILDEVPGKKAAADKAQSLVDAGTKQYAEWKEKAIKYKAQLEATYKDLAGKRPKATEGISPMLLSKYETIRQRHHEIGMALVTREMTCEECGNAVAEKNIQAINDDRTVQCEDCQRILYWTGGVA